MADTNKNSGQGTQSQGQQHQSNSPKPGQQHENQDNQSKGGNLMEQACEAGSSMVDKARDAASSVLHAAAEQADHARDSMAGGVRSLADSLRDHAPSDGMLGSAAGTVADTIEGSSHYLEHGGLGRMLDDVSGAIRRNPIPCMLCTLAFGFVLGRLLTSSGKSSRSL